MPQLTLITPCLWDWGRRELSRVEMGVGEPRLDVRWMQLRFSDGLLLSALLNQVTARVKRL